MNNKLAQHKGMSAMRLNVKWILIVTIATTMIGCTNYNEIKLTEAQRIELGATTPEAITKAQGHFDNTKYKKCASVLTKWINHNSFQHPFMDDALFLKGNACYSNENYFDALQAYELILKHHGASDHYSHAIYKEVDIATRFLEGEKRTALLVFKFSAEGDATEILTKVATRWPGSKLAVKALTLEANYYFDNKRYDEAQESYQLIVNSYSTTDSYQHALFRSAESTYLQYRAPLYENTPLTEAKFRFAQYLLKFPAGTNKNDANNRLQEIEEHLAEKEYLIAAFYKKTRKKEAAILYCQRIIEQWPQSEWAQKSRTLLVASQALETSDN